MSAALPPAHHTRDGHSRTLCVYQVTATAQGYEDFSEYILDQLIPSSKLFDGVSQQMCTCPSSAAGLTLTFEEGLVPLLQRSATEEQLQQHHASILADGVAAKAKFGAGFTGTMGVTKVMSDDTRHVLEVPGSNPLQFIYMDDDEDEASALRTHGEGRADSVGPLDLTIRKFFQVRGEKLGYEFKEVVAWARRYTVDVHATLDSEALELETLAAAASSEVAALMHEAAVEGHALATMLEADGLGHATAAVSRLASILMASHVPSELMQVLYTCERIERQFKTHGRVEAEQVLTRMLGLVERALRAARHAEAAKNEAAQLTTEKEKTPPYGRTSTWLAAMTTFWCVHAEHTCVRVCVRVCDPCLS